MVPTLRYFKNFYSAVSKSLPHSVRISISILRMYIAKAVLSLCTIHSKHSMVFPNKLQNSHSVVVLDYLQFTAPTVLNPFVFLCAIRTEMGHLAIVTLTTPEHLFSLHFSATPLKY